MNEQPCGNYIPNGDNDACECGRSMTEHYESIQAQARAERTRRHEARLAAMRALGNMRLGSMQWMWRLP